LSARKIYRIASHRIISCAWLLRFRLQWLRDKTRAIWHFPRGVIASDPIIKRNHPLPSHPPATITTRETKMYEHTTGLCRAR